MSKLSLNNEFILLISIIIFSYCSYTYAHYIRPVCISPLSLNLTENFAFNNNVDYQRYLGYIFSQTTGNNLNEDKAIIWFKKAANLGAPDAMYELYQLYSGKAYYSQTVAKQEDKEDINTAIMWLKKSANHNYSLAQYKLGDLYAQGKIVKQDSNKAIGWYKKAAQNGFAKAESIMGFAYENGQFNYKKNVNEAIKWYLKAAKVYPLAAYSLGVIYDPDNKETDFKYKDFSKAAKWYLIAAKMGDSSAQSAIGFCYLNGKGVKKDEVIGYAWLKVSLHGFPDPKLKTYLKKIRSKIPVANVTDAEILSSDFYEKYGSLH